MQEAVHGSDLVQRIGAASLFVVYPSESTYLGVVDMHSQQVLIRPKASVFTREQLDRAEEVLTNGDQKDRKFWISFISGLIGRKISRNFQRPFEYPYVCFPYSPTPLYFETSSEWALIGSRMRDKKMKLQADVMRSVMG